MRSGARRKPDAAAKTKHRIKHSTGGVRERLAVHDRQGRANAAPASEKRARSVSNSCRADDVAFDDGQVGGPCRRLVG